MFLLHAIITFVAHNVTSEPSSLIAPGRLRLLYRVKIVLLIILILLILDRVEIRLFLKKLLLESRHKKLLVLFLFYGGLVLSLGQWEVMVDFVRGEFS